MSTKNIKFVGYEAIGDLRYIPSVFKYRDDLIELISGYLEKSLNNNYLLNIIIQGILGIGKTTVIRICFKALIKEKRIKVPFHTIPIIDCTDKSKEFILFRIIKDLNQYFSLRYNLQNYVNSNFNKLKKLFILVRSRIDMNLIVILTNVEQLKIPDYAKLLNLLKETEITTISTRNKKLIPYELSKLPKFDFKFDISNYLYNQNLDIIIQRWCMAFKLPLEEYFDILEFINFLLHQCHRAAPRHAIQFLQEIYDYLEKNKEISRDDLIDLFGITYDWIDYYNMDVFDEYIFVEPDFYEYLLYELANFFSQDSKVKISTTELKELIESTSVEFKFRNKILTPAMIASLLSVTGILISENRLKNKSYSILNNFDSKDDWFYSMAKIERFKDFARYIDYNKVELICDP